MVCKIDRYLLRQFLQTLVICFLSLAGLYVVIDAFGHLDHFADYADKHGSLLAVVANYYGYRMIEIFDRMSGILALLATMFTVTWIQRHHEMTALLAAGITRWRVLRPVLIAALAVGVIAAANREYFMPKLRHELALDSKNLGGERAVDLHSRFDSETDILLAGQKIVPGQQRIIRPSFVLPMELDLYGKQLTADEAHYIAPQEGRVGGYLLSGVKTPAALLSSSSLRLRDGRAVVITPQDEDWLKTDQLLVASGVSFEFLASGSTWRDYASTRELVRELKSPSTDLGADVRVAVHRRVLQPFLDATLIFLGLPLVVSRGNSNPFVAIGIGMLVVTAFMLVVIGCQSLGSTGWMQPAFSAWLPLIVFAPIAVAMSGPLSR